MRRHRKAVFISGGAVRVYRKGAERMDKIVAYMHANGTLLSCRNFGRNTPLYKRGEKYTTASVAVQVLLCASSFLTVAKSLSSGSVPFPTVIPSSAFRTHSAADTAVAAVGDTRLLVVSLARCAAVFCDVRALSGTVTQRTALLRITCSTADTGVPGIQSLAYCLVMAAAYSTYKAELLVVSLLLSTDVFCASGALLRRVTPDYTATPFKVSAGATAVRSDVPSTR